MLAAMLPVKFARSCHRRSRVANDSRTVSRYTRARCFSKSTISGVRPLKISIRWPSSLR